MGNMIGSGVFLLPASLAPYGGVSLIGWLVSSTGAVLLALVFARLAAFNPATGGPYAYTRQAYGDFAGFIVAWGYWISAWCANAALAVAFVGYIGPFFPALVQVPAASAVVAIGAVWLLTAVNIWGIRSAGRVQVATTVLKIIPLVVIGIAGIAMLDTAHFVFAPAAGQTMVGAVMATATLTLWALMGLECATVPAGNTVDADRTIPRATIAGTVLTAVIYIASTLGVMGLLAPGKLGQSTAPFADAARLLAGDWAASLVAIGAAISCFGALNGWVLMVGQIPMAGARDGLFPRIFGHLSNRGTPARGMMIGGVLAAGLIAMNYSRGLVALFTFIILLSTLSSLVPYTFCALAGFMLRNGTPPMKWSAAAAWTASLAFAYSIFAIAGAGTDVVYYGFLMLMCGLPVYAWAVSAKR